MLEILINKRFICWPSQKDGGDFFVLRYLSTRCSSVDHLREIGENISERWWRYLSSRVSSIDHLGEILEMLINKKPICWPSEINGGDTYQQEAHLLINSEIWQRYLSTRCLYFDHFKEMVDIFINKRFICCPSQRDATDIGQLESHLLTISKRWRRYHLSNQKRLVCWIISEIWNT